MEVKKEDAGAVRVLEEVGRAEIVEAWFKVGRRGFVAIRTLAEGLRAVGGDSESVVLC